MSKVKMNEEDEDSGDDSSSENSSGMKKIYLKNNKWFIQCIFFKHLETSEDSVEVEVPFKVGMWDLKQCDPKRCTGRKLMKLELIDKLGMSAMFNGIVLTPVATEVK